MTVPAERAPEPWPGHDLGLPSSGAGSLAGWRSRIVAIIVDWAACMVVAVAMFGPEVINGYGWKRWMVLVTFFVQSAVLSAFTAGSFGQLLTRIAVIRLDGEPLGWRAVPRAFLVSLGIPPLVIGADRRGLHDLTCGTVVVNRR